MRKCLFHKLGTCGSGRVPRRAGAGSSSATHAGMGNFPVPLVHEGTESWVARHIVTSPTFPNCSSPQYSPYKSSQRQESPELSHITAYSALLPRKPMPAPKWLRNLACCLGVSMISPTASIPSGKSQGSCNFYLMITSGRNAHLAAAVLIGRPATWMSVAVCVL